MTPSARQTYSSLPGHQEHRSPPDLTTSTYTAYQTSTSTYRPAPLALECPAPHSNSAYSRSLQLIDTLVPSRWVSAGSAKSDTGSRPPLCHTPLRGVHLSPPTPLPVCIAAAQHAADGCNSVAKLRLWLPELHTKSHLPLAPPPSHCRTKQGKLACLFSAPPPNPVSKTINHGLLQRCVLPALQGEQA